MTTNGVSIPDDEKVPIPEGEYISEDGWIELTNHVGYDPQIDIENMEKALEDLR